MIREPMLTAIKKTSYMPITLDKDRTWTQILGKTLNTVFIRSKAVQRLLDAKFALPRAPPHPPGPPRSDIDIRITDLQPPFRTTKPQVRRLPGTKDVKPPPGTGRFPEKRNHPDRPVSHSTLERRFRVLNSAAKTPR